MLKLQLLSFCFLSCYFGDQGDGKQLCGHVGDTKTEEEERKLVLRKEHWASTKYMWWISFSIICELFLKTETQRD
jgi:hypothetical protein